MDAEGGDIAPGGEEEPMTSMPSSDEPVADAAAEGATPESQARPEMPADTEASSGPTAAGAAGPPTDEFMRDLVDAMRRVADEARDTGLADLRARADEQGRGLEGDAERRREELRERADKDVAEVGEWERAELERIKQEAEQRVASRRAQLDRQLAADASRTE